MKKILVLNSGSSSLKYQLFGVDGDKYEVIAKGLLPSRSATVRK